MNQRHSQISSSRHVAIAFDNVQIRRIDWPTRGSPTCVAVIGTDSGDHVLADAETAVAETFATSVTPAYDEAGNMTYDGLYTYAYDAWNRLVAVQRPGAGASPTPQPIGQYRYDGLGRRIHKAVTHSGQRDGTEYYYYANWQLLEVRRDVTGSEDDRASHQFVWGSQYIDEAVCMDVDTNADGDCTDGSGSRRFFYCQDANYNVTALREGSTIVERYEYDPYGTVRIYKGWSSAAGCELQQVTGQSLKWVDGGLPENPVLYCGYYHDSETKRYKVRRRDYDPHMGRWMQRDPAQYHDGANLYQYTRGNPILWMDPTGLWTNCRCECCTGERRLTKVDFVLQYVHKRTPPDTVGKAKDALDGALLVSTVSNLGNVASAAANIACQGYNWQLAYTIISESIDSMYQSTAVEMINSDLEGDAWLEELANKPESGVAIWIGLYHDKCETKTCYVVTPIFGFARSKGTYWTPQKVIWFKCPAESPQRKGLGGFAPNDLAGILGALKGCVRQAVAQAMP